MEFMILILKKNPSAIKFPVISYNEVIQKNLRVMDLTAITLCQDNSLPIVVFNMNEAGNLKRILHGDNIGSVVSLPV